MSSLPQTYYAHYTVELKADTSSSSKTKYISAKPVQKQLEDTHTIAPIQIGLADAPIEVTSKASDDLSRQIHDSKSQIISFVHSNDPECLEDDAFTSKIGGLPCWLEITNETEVLNPGNSGTQQSSVEHLGAASTEGKRVFEIPKCPHCTKAMMLVTQLFAPYDVPVTSTDEGAPLAISSFASSHFVIPCQYRRYPRSVYVFACNSSGSGKKCAFKQDTWRAIVMCHSEGKLVQREGTAKELRNPCEESKKILKEAKRALRISDAFVSSDEAQGEFNDEDATDDDDEFEDLEEGKSEEQKRMELKANEQTILAKVDEIISKNKIVSTKGASKPKDNLFDIGGWSDDSDEAEEGDDEDNKEPECDQADQLSAAPEEPTRTQDAVSEVKMPEVLDNNESMKAVTVYPKASKELIRFAYKPMYISWDSEPASLDSAKRTRDDYAYENQLLEEYERREQTKISEIKQEGSTQEEDGLVVTTDANDGWGEDDYQASNDKAFRRFLLRTSLVPDQCVRYSGGGKPLKMHEGKYNRSLQGISQDSKVAFLRSDNSNTNKGSLRQNASTIPLCPCGGRRMLEFQLMPQLFTVLLGSAGISIVSSENNENKTDDDPKAIQPTFQTGEVGLEFGTVDVYTCENACNRGHSIDGFCVVQEPV